MSWQPLKQKPQIQMAIMEIFQKYIGAYFLMPWNLIFTNSTIPLPHGTHPSWRWNVSLLNSLIDENSTIKAIMWALLNMIYARTDKKSDNTKSIKSLTLIECHTPYHKKSRTINSRKSGFSRSKNFKEQVIEFAGSCTSKMCPRKIKSDWHMLVSRRKDFMPFTS